MALTPHGVLRTRLLSVLARLGGSAQRSQVLARLDEEFRDQWTADDLSSPATRQFETKWRNRVSFERQRMVTAGLLEERSDGIWSLTDFALRERSRSRRSGVAFRDREITRRNALWEALKTRSDTENVDPSIIRDLRIYVGGRGVYSDVDVTRDDVAPAGVMVSVLHLGEQYANELSATGIIYHYPRTQRPGRDAAEISSIEAAFKLGVPIFVIVRPAPSARVRAVKRAFIEELNPGNSTALITFIGEDAPPPPPPGDDGDAPFDLTALSADARWALRRTRPHQARFAFQVMRRYGSVCAVCELAVPLVLEAAHLRPKAAHGSDDARNGIALCRNHHRMFDTGLWRIQPDTLEVLPAGQQTLQELGITRSAITHLPALPHPDALRDVWDRSNK